MNEQEFSGIVRTTKAVVLAAIRDHLAPELVYAIDDVAQETYVRAYKHLRDNKFEHASKITTWLYIIAKNESLRMNQKLIKDKKLLTNLTTKYDQSKTVHYDSFADEEEKLDQEVVNLIPKLPQKYREVMELGLNGVKERDIASMLHISQGTVKSRRSRAKSLLKKYLKTLTLNQR